MCLAASAGFLGCKADNLPFKFLGCMVGGNQRCCAFWNPIVKALEARLSAWKGRMLSIGGRVTLINSVLANMPNYYFSFYKAPALVIKKIEAIQRNFLWSGMVERKGIVWVSWLDICKGRDKRGLGVKHMGHFNRAMLSKWIWRFLVEDEAIWWGILKVRYGDIRRRLWGCQSHNPLSKESNWWKDIMCLCEASKGVIPNIRSTIINGKDILFWKHCWIRGCSLNSLFPNLYS